ncbi:MAG TPA: S8 family serine peptidase, partial [Caldilineae bacterium]|nr:S8 family serine peptidase [Caldilineae bacterium]
MKVEKVLKNVPLLLILAALVTLPLLLWATPAHGSPSVRPSFASGRILVKFKPGTSPADRAALHRAQRGKLVREISGIKVEVVRVPAGTERGKAIAYARSPIVAYAEPDYIAYALGDPNDEYFAKQWGLDNDGQEYKDGQSGTVDADIDAPEAWDIITGTAEVKIAILDTGIDQDHPDLDDKLVSHINFTDSDTVDDLYGHGTHVAGIAAAETNNSQGVAGTGYNSSLMNVKVLNDDGMGYYSWVAQGVVWAADNGAKVINMSLGGTRKSRTLEDAVNYAWSKDVVLAAAAGNSGNPSPTYPAKYENCIAVAATDSDDQKASFSEWGSWVDVAAPGVDVFSTFPNHPYVIGKSLSYDYGSGTSMSTPFVSGLAALVWATGYG